MSTPVRTTCAYCGVGCGVVATPGPDGVAIKGDPDHPANLGRLCSKGSALGETLGTEGRLLAPQIGNRSAGWDEALDLVSGRFAQTIAEHGPDSVAFYVSGQLLTEDYYVANKLMKGFIGSANIDTNSRLCMASTVAGHKRAFGTDTVPGIYEDLELADLVVLVGSNLAWCHPVLYQRLVAAKAASPEMKVVVVDPRHTATCDLADLHLQINPGSDVSLFNRLFAELHASGCIDAGYVGSCTNGFNETFYAASSDDCSATGLDEAEICDFLRLWVRTERTVTVFSQGVNQSSHGTDKVNAILNCHLATGRIGKPGMGPFSVTGQPNAMGGREVGGLANTLTCHLDIENADHRLAVQQFWNAPAMPATPGLKAVEMFDAVAGGRIKALWIMCTNPAVSMPDATKVQQAIADCDFTVVSDMYATTDTARLADVVLPATGWGEKSGSITNSERMISRQRAIVTPPGQARHDWDIISDVGRRMGWKDAFSYDSPAQISREHASLSGLASALGRDFDISGLTALSDAEYADMPPTRWPVTADATGQRLFSDGQFFTPDGKANLVPVRQPRATPAPHRLRLNTGRIRDQWHTMTRSGLSPSLSRHLAEPFLEINPEDATILGLAPAALARVESRGETAILRVLVTDRIKPGTAFAPMHWSSERAPSGRINQLVIANPDPVSGQPDSKATEVTARPYEANWFGFAIGTKDLAPKTQYWARARLAGGWQCELACQETPSDWIGFARSLFDAPDAQVSSVAGPNPSTARVALHQEGRLIGAFFAAAQPISLSRHHIADQLGTTAPNILAGRPGANQPDPGATVCACFAVGVNSILNAIRSDNLMTVDQIGAALQAGTSCGSCRPELSALLDRSRRGIAAE